MGTSPDGTRLSGFRIFGRKYCKYCKYCREPGRQVDTGGPALYLRGRPPRRSPAGWGPPLWQVIQVILHRGRAEHTGKQCAWIATRRIFREAPAPKGKRTGRRSRPRSRNGSPENRTRRGPALPGVYHTKGDFSMNREQAAELVRMKFRDELQRDKSGKGFICPICGSGSGRKGTGITENPRSPEHFTCWAGCFQNADAFDIIAQLEGVQPGTGEAMRAAYERYGIEIDRPEGPQKAHRAPERAGGIPTHDTPRKEPQAKPQAAPAPDFSAKIKEAREAFEGSPAETYIQGRGISSSTARRYWLDIAGRSISRERGTTPRSSFRPADPFTRPAIWRRGRDTATPKADTLPCLTAGPFQRPQGGPCSSQRAQ